MSLLKYNLIKITSMPKLKLSVLLQGMLSRFTIALGNLKSWGFGAIPPFHYVISCSFTALLSQVTVQQDAFVYHCPSKVMQELQITFKCNRTRNKVGSQNIQVLIKTA